MRLGDEVTIWLVGPTGLASQLAARVESDGAKPFRPLGSWRNGLPGSFAGGGDRPWALLVPVRLRDNPVSDPVERSLDLSPVGSALEIR